MSGHDGQVLGSITASFKLFTLGRANQKLFGASALRNRTKRKGQVTWAELWGSITFLIQRSLEQLRGREMEMYQQITSS